MYCSVSKNIILLKQVKHPPAPLPTGYEGEFGPGIKALVMSLYYGGNMTMR